MTRLRIPILLLLLVLAGPGIAQSQDFPSALPEEAGLDPDRVEALTGMLDRYVADGLLPGGQLLVLRDGYQVVNHAFGTLDREAGTPMPENGIYRIASQSKAIVSVAVMMLQEEGKLLIKDPLGKYMPEWMETTVAVKNEAGGYDVVKADRRITIRDLLTHTAGVDYGYGPAAQEWVAAGIQGWYFGHMTEPIRETVRRMAALPQAAQPGTAFVYGYNTDILGALVEVVSGQSLDAFLSDNILEPLGMTDTHFYLPSDKTDRLAVVYSTSDDGLVRTPDVSAMVGQGAYVDGPRMSFSGGAGLLSTAHDYARFLQMVMQGGQLDGVRLLSGKSVDLMLSDHLGTIPYGAGVGMGLGFEVVDDLGAYGQLGSEGAFGWGGAYHSTYWADPQESMVVVYFTQVLPAARLDDHAKIRALIYGAIVD